MGTQFYTSPHKLDFNLLRLLLFQAFVLSKLVGTALRYESKCTTTLVTYVVYITLWLLINKTFF